MHHGTPDSAHELWPPHVEEAAARGLRLAGYSRPGSGSSDRDQGRSVASCAADAAAVADALGAERFLTAGGSGGGPHALACAALLPDRVLAAAIDRRSRAGRRRGTRLARRDGRGEPSRSSGRRRPAPRTLERVPRAGGRRSFARRRAPTLLESLGDLVSPPDAAVLSGEYAEFGASSFHLALSEGIWVWFDDDLAFIRDWGFDLGAIEVPVTIWQGRQDRFVPVAHGEWLAANVAGATAHILDEHGHLSLALAHFGEILDDLMSRLVEALQRLGRADRASRRARGRRQTRTISPPSNARDACTARRRRLRCISPGSSRRASTSTTTQSPTSVPVARVPPVFVPGAEATMSRSRSPLARRDRYPRSRESASARGPSRPAGP